MTQTFDLSAFDAIAFDPPAMAAAVEEIKANRLHHIHCSLTGYPYGVLADEELNICLRAILQNDPTMSSSKLVDAFVVRHAILSSGPSPALRLHTNYHTLVNALRADEINGTNKLFCYIMGRFFFDVLTPTRAKGSFGVHRQRLDFLTRLQRHVARLPAKWWETECEEAVVLECMLRVDSIFSLNNAVDSSSAAPKFVRWAQQHSNPFEFSILRELLLKLEADKMGQLTLSSPTPSGNAMIISAAMKVLRRRQPKIDANDSITPLTLVERVYSLTIQKRMGPASTAGQLLQNIQQILTEADMAQSMSKLEKQRLTVAVDQLAHNIDQVTFTDKRLDEMKRVNARIARTGGGEVIKHVGPKVAKELDILYGRRPAPKKSTPKPKKQLTPEQATAFDMLMANFKQFSDKAED